MQPLKLTLGCVLVGVALAWSVRSWAEESALEDKEKSKPAAAAKTDAPVEVEQEKSLMGVVIEKFMSAWQILIILLALSVVGVSTIVERSMNLRQAKIATPGLIEEVGPLYTAGKFSKVMNTCKDDDSVLAHIIRAVIDHRNCHVADIQEISGDIGSRRMRMHLAKAYPLLVVATIAPLLGLLGTIIGMMGAFDTVAAQEEMGNAGLLAGDISMALVTTAGGLIVAIPMLGAYHFFKNRANALAITLEEEVSELISAWFLKVDDVEEAA